MKAIGFTTVYYTLWEVTQEKTYVTVNNEYRFAGMKTNYVYYRNLSKDLEKAKNKFVELTGLTPPDVDEDLNGKNSSFSTFKKANVYKDGEFTNGKYEGTLISDCNDINYLLWAFDNILYDDNKNIAKKVLLDNGYVENIDKSGVCTKEELAEQIITKKELELENSIIRGFNFNDKEKVELEVIVHNIGGFNTMYGYTNVYQFLSKDLKLIIYKGAKEYDNIEIGDKITIKGTIKHNSFYSNSIDDDVKETKILRMKIL